MLTIRDKIQQDAVKHIIENNYSGFIDVSPRVGKSKIVCDVIREMKTPILITVPENSIQDSWMLEFQEWNVDVDNIVLINQRSIEKEDLSKYGLVVCDEIHTLSENQIEELKGAKCILGLSGSISKETEKTLKNELKIKKIFEYSISQAIKDGIISDYKIYTIGVDLDKENKYIKAGTKKKSWMSTEYRQYEYYTRMFEKFKRMSWYNEKLKFVKMKWAGERANLLYNAKSKLEIAQKIISDYSRCLIFTARTEIADQLATAHHSKNKDEGNLEKFMNGEINKLALCGMANMGVTFPDLKVGIFHQIKSSEESAIQKVMRMCNLEDDKTAEIFITYYKNTSDQTWVEKALTQFNDDKIIKLTADEIK